MIQFVQKINIHFDFNLIWRTVMNKPKVCGVVVTYNRKELLFRNVKSLLAQSYPLDILIYDNASTDGTYAFLKENGILEFDNVFYVNGDKNIGGAGGFCEGEKIAYEKGYDYIWLMDDDGYCINEDTLMNLMQACSKERCIYNSYVICDIEEKKPTFDIGGAKSFSEVLNCSEHGILHGVGNPYNGTLVPRECFTDIGFTDYRFFIYGDEYDFVARSKKAGYNWETIVDSLYYHPVNRNVTKEFSVLGHKFDVKEQPVWKLYLEIRNSTYNSIVHNGNTFIPYFVFKAVLISINSKDKKSKRLKYSLLGVHDAIHANFDREIMFWV